MGRGRVADRDPVRGAGPAQARDGVQVSVRAWLGLEGLRSGSEEVRFGEIMSRKHRAHPPPRDAGVRQRLAVWLHPYPIVTEQLATCITVAAWPGLYL